MKVNFSTKFIFSCLVLNLMTLSQVHAWGLYIPLSSISDLGQEFSGGAALAPDASTNYTNPAGLTRFDHPQFVLGGSTVDSKFTYRGTMTNPGLGSPVFQSGKTATMPKGILPIFHFVTPLPHQFAFGFSVLVPYGLSLSYSNHSLVRYDVLYAQQKSFDITPSLAYQFNPQFSVGLGLDVLNYEITEKYASRTQALTFQDSTGTFDGSSWNLGWHGGVLYQCDQDTRFGFAYHSQFITHNDGTSHYYLSESFFLPQPLAFRSNNTTIKVPLASIATLSAYHRFAQPFALMGTIQRLGWDVYQYDHIKNVSIPGGTTDIVLPRKLQTSWLYALGANYFCNDQWLFRTGMSYVSSATETRYRDIFITDPATFNVSIGAHYQTTKNLGWDFAFAKPFFEKVTINHLTANTGNYLVGTVSQRSIGSFAAQMVYDFI